MPPDYSGQNLQRRSFNGQNLIEANFSKADTRGANFTNAILKDADFTGAKAGLQQRWVICLLIVVGWVEERSRSVALAITQHLLLSSR
ncbi:pentapeptide repeat-containing protein [Dolichospermum sp. UHCC 0259]|nr:pentapeptide repeat-containing protein [Dolichospermum sp. UHCC 0259]